MNDDCYGVGVEKGKDVYVPFWAQTLIDLYTSDLRYEVLGDIEKDSVC